MQEAVKKKTFAVYEQISCECGSVMVNNANYAVCMTPTCDLFGVRFKLRQVELEPVPEDTYERYGG